MSHKVLLSIGITGAKDLPKLNGAGRSAEAITNWGKLQGYDCQLITDDKNVNPNATPVTAALVKKALETLIGEGGQDRIIISFAGHGLRRDGAEELWLLNNWKAAPGGINHVALRERLESYLPKQIGFISDVCRTLPTSEGRHIEGSAIIDYKEYREASVQTVTLHGTLAAQPAFSTPAKEEAQYCFFSKVVYDALRGKYSENTDQLTHNQLVRILRAELPQLVSQYKRKQDPDPKGNFDTPDIWSDLTIEMSGLNSLDLPDPPYEETGGIIVRPEVIFLPSKNNKDGDVASSGPGLQIGPISGNHGGNDSIQYTRGSVTIYENRSKLPIPPLPGPPNLLAQQDIEHLADIKLQFFTDQIAQAESSRWPHLIVAGDEIKSVSTEPGFNLLDSEKQNESDVVTKTASSLLVHLRSGDYAGAAMYDDMRTVFVCDNIGVESLTIESRGFNSKDSLALDAKASLGGQFSDPADIAATLREYKHVNPVLGVQAAYAYAVQGATNDIRRTAYFYAQKSQPLPFDIALLAKIEMEFKNGVLIAKIPAVKKRKPRSEIEKAHSYTFVATPKITCNVAGVFPWMRQGWAFVESNRNAFVRELAPYRSGLRASMYTTLSSRTGKKLDRLIGNL